MNPPSRRRFLAAAAATGGLRTVADARPNVLIIYTDEHSCWTLGAYGSRLVGTPNLDSLLKPWKGEAWIGYQDPTHISLKPPAEWLGFIRTAGFRVRRVFSDGFWDVPYVRGIPKRIQKLFFGALGGFQAISGLVFLPLKWGESMIVIARKV